MIENNRFCHLKIKKKEEKKNVTAGTSNISEGRKKRLNHKKQFISGGEQEANQLALQIRPILSGREVNAPLNGIPSDKQKVTKNKALRLLSKKEG